MGVISRAVMEAREQLLGPPFCMLVVAEQQQAVAEKLKVKRARREPSQHDQLPSASELRSLSGPKVPGLLNRNR
jgi:hypothetical protein